MDQVNGTTSPKKKQVLFSIGSYSERDKRVINKISTNGLFASATTDDAAALRSQPTRTLPKTRPVSLNFIDTSPKYRTLPARHRYTDGINVEKPACPPSSVCSSPATENGPVAGKPAFPPKLVDRSLSLEPEQLRHSGRVAMTIAAYEGEPRTPTRLDFLPSGRGSRASSKASSSTASTPGEDVDGSRMMLQNELVATLKRSNLKKLIEDDVFLENGHSAPEKSQPVEEPKSTKAIEELKDTKPAEELKKTEATEDLKKVEAIEDLDKITPVEELESKPEKDLDKIKPVEEENKPEKDLEKITHVEEPENKPEKDLDKITSVEEPENKLAKEDDIAAALTELENSTEESETIPPPPPPPMPEPEEKPAVKEEPKTDMENGEPKELETVELSKDETTKQSKDETDEVSNGSVKQLAVELGKKMTFKADIERVPEQNGIKDE